MKNTKNPGMFVIVQGTSLLKVASLFLLFMLMVFSISGLLTSLKPEYRPISSSVNQAATNVDGKLLYQIMGWENHHFLQIGKGMTASPKLTNLIFKLSTNINLNDPRSLLGRELPGFYQFDGQIVVAGEGTNYTNMPVESAPPAEIMKAEREASLQNLQELKPPTGDVLPPKNGQTTGSHKVVYLYFTHNRESYLPNLKGVTDPNLAYHSQYNVTKVGDEIKSRLLENGIGATVDKTDVMGALTRKGLKMPQAYQESSKVVQTAMTTNRDLQYFIDIHRDSRRKAQTTVTIDGKSYAKLAFVIGGKNPNYEKNLKLATDINNLLKKKFGNSLSRGIFIKRDIGDNGVYNQQLSSNAILIEFGGVDNTFEELDRSADALADVFSEFYWQAEKVNQDENQPANNQ
ncbi:stage II sporulation protein P [Neobacillus sp. PS3-40]|uniref:stage II sporulation protein P n=1 Tax=Neobacillus sp. PS3-40 TaxID=3070679 RepID=UPI0027DFBB35|nr:stage II sporulation protein P [Neobacillus sp. PS3-40]WML45367.1 stage II sporulation protein P [Neobacillus sp. PS3-40]